MFVIPMYSITNCDISKKKCRISVNKIIKKTKVWVDSSSFHTRLHRICNSNRGKLTIHSSSELKKTNRKKQSIIDYLYGRLVAAFGYVEFESHPLI